MLTNKSQFSVQVIGSLCEICFKTDNNFLALQCDQYMLILLLSVPEDNLYNTYVGRFSFVSKNLL